jgi:starch synthase
LSPDVQTPFNPHDNTGTGWTFDFADGGAFRGAVHNALQTYRWMAHCRSRRSSFPGVMEPTCVQSGLCFGAHDGAVDLCRHHQRAFEGIQLRGMNQDLTWDNAAQQYEEVFVAAKYQW